LDAGIVRPQLQPVFLPGLLAELAESFKPFAERKGLRLAVRCPDITVTGDRVRGATSPDGPDPSPQPYPARERGHVAAFTRHRTLHAASSFASKA
ncbi:hypothetical protein MKL11_21850, partial [Methylobacterium sp. J-077]|nr:hypothetical protein [Methylobacterium sp. J-077]